MTPEITIEVDGTYADVSVNGALVASIDVTDSDISPSVTTRLVDPRDPDDTLAEYQFDVPE